MKSIIDLKDDKFFKHKIVRHEEFLYKTLTTGEPIGETDSRIIDKISKLACRLGETQQQLNYK